MKKATEQSILAIIDELDNPVKSEDVDPAVDLTDQGIDSLDFMSLLFQLDQQFQIDIPDDANLQVEWNTVERIVEKVNGLLAEGAE